MLQKHKNYLEHLGKRQVLSVVLRPTDAYEIIETIAGLKHNKSPGYIDIPAILIKEFKFVIAHYLAMSFNKCLEKGTYVSQYFENCEGLYHCIKTDSKRI